MSGLHTVTFKADPDSDDFETEIVCHGGSGCAVWWECREDGCKPANEEEEDDGEYTRHGRFHQRIDGMWCLEPIPGKEHCAAHEDGARDDISDIYFEHGEGTYTVEVSYWGDCMWEASLIKDGAA